MLTEKECRQALEILKAQVNYENVDAIICFKELIDEHHDNPPLGFEELIKHKVVWDNEIKEFAFVLEQYKPTILNVPAPSDLQAISLEYRGGEIECLLSEEVGETINDYYQPNRFYRKEVQK